MLNIKTYTIILLLFITNNTFSQTDNVLSIIEILYKNVKNDNKESLLSISNETQIFLGKQYSIPIDKKRNIEINSIVVDIPLPIGIELINVPIYGVKIRGDKHQIDIKSAFYGDFLVEYTIRRDIKINFFHNPFFTSAGISHNLNYNSNN